MAIFTASSANQSGVLIFDGVWIKSLVREMAFAIVDASLTIAGVPVWNRKSGISWVGPVF